MSENKHALPRAAELGGERFTLRRMGDGDREAVLAFARALPEHDLVFLPRDITEPKVVDAWLRGIGRGDIVSVLACRGEAVVGCSTLVRDPHSWSAHVGELRLVLLPDLRGKGLGQLLAQEAFVLGLEAGCEKMTAQMTVDQTGAIAIFEGLGFAPEAMLRDHVRDRSGQVSDVVVLSHDVARFRARLETYGVTEAV